MFPNPDYPLSRQIAICTDNYPVFRLVRCNLDRRTMDDLALGFKAIKPIFTTLLLNGNNLGLTKGLKIPLDALPSHISSLDLSANDLDKMPLAELLATLAIIPPTIIELNLSENNLGAKSIEDLLLILASVPNTVVRLGVGNNKLRFKTIEDMKKLFTAFSRQLISLDLFATILNVSATGLPFTKEELKAAFDLLPNSLELLSLSNHSSHADILSILPVGLKSLNLSQCFNKTSPTLESVQAIGPLLSTLNLSANWLGHTDELDNICSAVQPSVTYLDLSANELFHKNTEQLTHALRSLSDNITGLNLSENKLGRLTGSDLFLIFKGIKSSVTSLELQNNQLNLVMASRIGLQMALPALANIISLDLSSNDLFMAKDEFLIPTIMALSPTIKKLNLSDNNFGCRDGSKLIFALKAMPVTLQSLNLSRNYLESLRAPIVKQVLGLIPTTLKELNLSYNNFKNTSNTELIDAFSSLPPTLEWINLTGINIDRPVRDLIAILNSLPKKTRVICEDNSQLAAVINFLRQEAYESIKTYCLPPELCKEVIKGYWGSASVSFWNQKKPSLLRVDIAAVTNDAALQQMILR